MHLIGEKGIIPVMINVTNCVTMNKTILSIALVLFGLMGFESPSFDDSYESLWTQVVKLERERRPQSALKIVEKIYAKARAEQEQIQLTRAIIYKAKFKLITKEDGYEAVCQMYKEEIAVASSPTKEVLLSLEANLYQNYLNQNLYNIQQRTRIDDFEENNPVTWPVNTFVEKIGSNYERSLSNPEVLQQSLKEYEELLDEFKDEDLPYTPRIYDLLVNRALGFFTSNTTYLPKPFDAFSISQEVYFDEVEKFEKLAIKSPDSTDMVYRAMKLIQKQLQHSKQFEILHADINLKRLELVYQLAKIENKQELYIKSLQRLDKKHAKTKMHAVVLSKLAQAYVAKGNAAMPTRTDDYQTALKYAYYAYNNYTDHYSTAEAINIINNLNQKYLRLTSESVIPSNRNFIQRISYRNLDQVYFEIRKSNEAFFEKIEGTNDLHKSFKAFKSLPLVNSGSKKLFQDDLKYDTNFEMSFDGLPKGRYFLLVGEDENFDHKKSLSTAIILNVSDLAIEHRFSKDSYKAFVTDRNSGKAIEGARVDIFTQEYNYQSRKSIRNKINSKTTDKDGAVDLSTDASKSIYTEVFYQDDYLKENGRSHWRPSRSNAHNQYVLFTDRAIYRPGQTLHYKLLAMQRDNNSIPSLLPNHQVSIQLLNANRQEVFKKETQTNQYGSTNATVQLPKGTLNGSFVLKVNGKFVQNIRVEEYKRPKFSITELPLSEGYKMGDTVKVRFEAKSFVGAAIQNMDAKYRVVREVRFPWWNWSCGFRFPSHNQSMQEIANGEVKTDAQGIASISFKALENLEVLPKWNPMYIYTVYLDITDGNGETQSAIQYVRIGSKTRTLGLNFTDAKIVKGREAKAFTLSIKDLNGNPQSGKGTIEIWKAKESSKVLNQRLWGQNTVYQELDSIQFAARHPDDVYKARAENQPSKKEKVGELSFDHQGDAFFDLPKLKGGQYILHAKLKDENGEKIDAIASFEYLNPSKNILPKSQHLYWWVKDKKEPIAPDQKYEIELLSNTEDLHVLVRIDRRDKDLEERWVLVNKKAKIVIPIEERDRGGLDIKMSYVINNRAYDLNLSPQIPWINKELEIKFKSFRSELLPGQKEKYSIKISGNEKEKVAAELLCGMYDASLDEFVPHQWQHNFFSSYRGSVYNRRNSFQQIGSSYYLSGTQQRLQWKGVSRWYPRFHDFGVHHSIHLRGGRFSGYNTYIDGVRVNKSIETDAEMMDEVVITERKMPKRQMDYASSNEVVSADEIRALPTKNINAIAAHSAGVRSEDTPQGNTSQELSPQLRKNLKETVFFFPSLRTDDKGNVEFEFQMNEALTKWKLMSFAHTKDLKSGFDLKELVTSKDIMVVPNPPRFVRDKDKIVLTAKVNNLSKAPIDAEVWIELFDPISNKRVDDNLLQSPSRHSLKIDSSSSDFVQWSLHIPDRVIDALSYRVYASAGNQSDGEENIFPVLTNKLLVTESKPLTVKGQDTKQFTIEQLRDAHGTKVYHNYALEYTSNPAWYAIQAMPYIIDYRGCSENSMHLSDMFYAQTLSTQMANSHPKIKAIFDSWKRKSSEELQSKLFKNEELKSALLQETPWVRQAMSESEQKQNIALLFDLNTMSDKIKGTFNRLAKYQKPDGGFSWFDENRSNRYVSHYILENLGHLKRLGALKSKPQGLHPVLQNLLAYCDAQIVVEYKKSDKKDISQSAIQYLYVRSFFKEEPASKESKKALTHYLEKAKENGLSFGIYQSAIIALVLKRYGQTDEAEMITASLIERALIHEELGMYWNEGTGFRWFELPIERHAVLIELMVEMGEKNHLNDLKLWLLRNKQTNHWGNTKATAKAIYALLIEAEQQGISKWILEGKLATIKLGGQTLDFSNQTEDGTDYVKRSWKGAEIDASFSSVEIANPNDHVSWGGVYWQYFDEIENITHFKETPLKLKKSLFKKVLDDYGEKLLPLTSDTLKIGDELIVRLELEVDRSMEFVHLKDMRASGLEPLNTLSGYKYRHGLGYYQSSRDLATDFFISYLPKGKYVFEYPLRAQHEGSFSNGLTTIQCMYAPEYTSHSKGERLEIRSN